MTEREALKGRRPRWRTIIRPEAENVLLHTPELPEGYQSKPSFVVRLARVDGRDAEHPDLVAANKRLTEEAWTVDTANEESVAFRMRLPSLALEVVKKYTPEMAAPICGIEPERIRELGITLGKANAMIVFWGMGISQHVHGTDNARSVISLCLMTGNVGRPGTGLHPLMGRTTCRARATRA